MKHLLFVLIALHVCVQSPAGEAAAQTRSPVGVHWLDAKTILVGGKLSAKAEKGKAVFDKAGCAACHPGPLFTDLKTYDVGTSHEADRAGKKFDTPTLVELWRTAPYLHDGAATTLRDVLTEFNKGDKHGRTSQLSAEEMAALSTAGTVLDNRQ